MFGGLWLRVVVIGGGWWCGSWRGECLWFLDSTTTHFVSNCLVLDFWFVVVLVMLN